jgi:LPXTG-motif cell wall-anchored protein
MPTSPAVGQVPGILPITGFDLENMAEIAFGLVIVGSGAVLASRRRGNEPGNRGNTLGKRRA